MKNKISLPLWIIGFILLNLYFNGIPKLVQLDVLPWLMYAGGFFLLAFIVARYLLGLKGINSFGLPMQKGWMSDLGLGFIVGAAVWGLKYLVYYSLGKFEVTGLMDTGFIVGMLAQALLGMLLVSAINDIMIRGYWFAYLKKENLLKWFMLVTTVLYVADDFWNEGFGWQNIVFSALLGLALAYTVLKTNAIWMAIGIHFGSNMLYRVMAGFDGQGIFKMENFTDGTMYEYVGLTITALLLPLVYLLLRNRHVAAPEPQQTIATDLPETKLT
ncbi:CPBP family intramembrane glutamic endopeptidase [Pontibacter fetidus]|uniref:CPBP family intramembrane metalloprotease n=1 Tax=Pontibacter fetidus TaxID=2700082 RepID=A0A6B2H6F2_9BACT|nr:CPBP family intramembrane glutamic endopeptidase [Pontibacter fetidus]NDK55937.1 CPBP family intramembrane metalloprotease [Pontibacter fetidus]